jgi:uncharacterized coiled-coil DUF342 family protein
MTKDLSELVEYLDTKFTGIAVEFAEVRSDIGQVKSELSDLRERVDAIYDGLDAYAKKADTYFQEMLMLATKVDRHERWLHQVAEKLGVKLEY